LRNVIETKHWLFFIRTRIFDYTLFKLKEFKSWDIIIINTSHALQYLITESILLLVSLFIFVRSLLVSFLSNVKILLLNSYIGNSDISLKENSIYSGLSLLIYDRSEVLFLDFFFFKLSILGFLEFFKTKKIFLSIYLT